MPLQRQPAQLFDRELTQPRRVPPQVALVPEPADLFAYRPKQARPGEPRIPPPVQRVVQAPLLPMRAPLRPLQLRCAALRLDTSSALALGKADDDGGVEVDGRHARAFGHRSGTESASNGYADERT